MKVLKQKTGVILAALMFLLIAGVDRGSVYAADQFLLSLLGPTINISAISGDTTEAGGTATFTVELGATPTDTVTIPVSSSDTSEGTVAITQLVFTTANWSTAQTVTVTGVDDAVNDGNQNYTIVLGVVSSTDTNYNGFNPNDVDVTNTDDDTPGVTVSSISGNTTEAGGTATFTVVLTSQPTSSVSIGVSSNDTTEGTVSPSTLSFTTANWSAAQTVTVTGVNDDIDDGNINYTIVLAAATSSDSNYNGMNPTDVGVSNTDDDTAGTTATAISGNTTEAGGTATFTLKLDSQPTADVTFAISSNDTTEGTVSPSSLTFTSANWSTAQTVTVTGVDDSDVDGNVSYTVVIGAASSTDGSYTGMNPADVSVTNTDDDASTQVFLYLPMTTRSP